MRVQYFENVPIPEMAPTDQRSLSTLGVSCTNIADSPAETKHLTGEIATAERGIEAIVYRLLSLRLMSLYQPALTLTHLLAASARESGRYLSVRTRFLPWKAHAMRGPRRVKLCEIRYYVARNVSGRPISMEYRIDCGAGTAKPLVR